MRHDDRRWNIKDLRSARLAYTIPGRKRDNSSPRIPAFSAANGVEGPSEFKGASRL